MNNVLKGIETIRRENTIKLMELHGLSRGDFAEQSGISYAQLGHYIGKNPTKNIGNKIAEKIETFFNKPKNWLDYEHEENGEILTGQGEPEPSATLLNKTIQMWEKGDTPPDGMIAIEFLTDITASLGNGYINDEYGEKSELWLAKTHSINAT